MERSAIIAKILDNQFAHIEPSPEAEYELTYMLACMTDDELGLYYISLVDAEL